MEKAKCWALSGPNPGYAYRCDLDKGHVGQHHDSRYYESWGKDNPICTHSYAAKGGTFRCTKPQGHDMGHLTYINGMKHGWSRAPYRAWFQKEYDWAVQDARYRANVLGAFDEGTELKTALTFTVQELAELYCILVGNHDIPAVYLNKVGKALKEML